MLKLVKTDLETAEIVYIFFSNIVQNINISRYSNDQPYVNYIKDVTLKTILNIENIEVSLLLETNTKIKITFLSKLTKKKLEKGILNLDLNKGNQYSNISIKLVKVNTGIFSDFICPSFNSSIKMSKSPENFKLADITPLCIKRGWGGDEGS